MAITSNCHAFSIDIEDWYQSSYDLNAPVNEICVQNTRHVLDFLQSFNVRGTFFVQGLVAKQYPHLVKEIHARGHEIQSHGYSHRPVNRMTPSEFKREIKETNKCIEDVTGEAVTGFRAPDFSIDRGSFWAFEVMIECGIHYDSSIFPMKTRRYGIDGFENGYSIIQTASGAIHELTVNVLELNWPRGIKIPVGGGGYFRFFPAWFLKYALKKVEEQGLPFILYCHPYEFNPKEWKYLLRSVPLYRRYHQGIGREGFPGKVAQFLKMRKFKKMSEVLTNCLESERKVYTGDFFWN
jgi:polysaccharide deacetylase family protein (PEP-CTERM system associated)